MKKKKDKKLDKLLGKSFPKTKKVKSLLIVFLIITILSLGGIFVFDFYVCWHKDIFISISTGLFASGLYASASEALTIINKKARMQQHLDALECACHEVIDFISEGFEGENIEPQCFIEWCKLILSRDHWHYSMFNLIDRFENIKQCCDLFSNKNYDRFENPYLNEKKYLAIRSLFNVSRIIIVNLQSNSESNKRSAFVFLQKSFINFVVTIFPGFKKEFEKKISVPE